MSFIMSIPDQEGNKVRYWTWWTLVRTRIKLFKTLLKFFLDNNRTQYTPSLSRIYLFISKTSTGFRQQGGWLYRRVIGWYSHSRDLIGWWRVAASLSLLHAATNSIINLTPTDSAAAAPSQILPEGNILPSDWRWQERRQSDNQVSVSRRHETWEESNISWTPPGPQCSTKTILALAGNEINLTHF